MKKDKTTSAKSTRRSHRAALSQEAYENELISMAYDLVQQRLLDGTASSQETTTLMKAGIQRKREAFELEKGRMELELMKAKRDALMSQQHADEQYAKVLAALRLYNGKDEPEEEGYDEPYLY